MVPYSQSQNQRHVSWYVERLGPKSHILKTIAVEGKDDIIAKDIFNAGRLDSPPAVAVRQDTRALPQSHFRWTLLNLKDDRQTLAFDVNQSGRVKNITGLFPKAYTQTTIGLFRRLFTPANFRSNKRFTVVYWLHDFVLTVLWLS